MSTVTLRLTPAEALVLFEWFSRIDDTDPPPFADASEQYVAWRVLGQLESSLMEPLKANYEELLEKAKREIAREND